MIDDLQQFLSKLSTLRCPGDRIFDDGSWSDSLDEILTQRNAPELAKKIYILQDCTSAVVVPGGPDFTGDAEAAMKRFADAGMHIVDSTTPMDQWPDMQL